MPRFDLPETGVDPDAPSWVRDYGVKWTKSVDPPPVPKQHRHFRRFWALPGPVRFLVLLTSPLWLWLAVCLLAVGGWAVLAGFLVVIGAARPRRRGQPARNLLRRPRPPKGRVLRRSKPLVQPLNY